MKKVFLVCCSVGATNLLLACPTCEAQQPRLLRGSIHGPGPVHAWEYGFFFLALLTFVLTLFYSIKWLIHPGEPAADHIKNSILNDE